MLWQLRCEPFHGVLASFLPGVSRSVTQIPLCLLVGKAKRRVQHGEELPVQRRDNTYERSEHHAEKLHDETEQVEEAERHQEFGLDVEAKGRHDGVVEVRITHVGSVVRDEVNLSAHDASSLLVFEAAGCLEVAHGHIPHVDGIHSSFRQRHAEQDVFVADAVFHVAQQEAAALAIDVHRPNGAGGQATAVSEQLVVGQQGSLLSLPFGFTVVKLQRAVVNRVLVAVDDGLAFGIWSHDFDGAGVHEEGHVLLNTGFQKQLRAWRGWIFRGGEVKTSYESHACLNPEVNNTKKLPQTVAHQVLATRIFHSLSYGDFLYL